MGVSDGTESLESWPRPRTSGVKGPESLVDPEGSRSGSCAPSCSWWNRMTILSDQAWTVCCRTRHHYFAVLSCPRGGGQRSGALPRGPASREASVPSVLSGGACLSLSGKVYLMEPDPSRPLPCGRSRGEVKCRLETYDRRRRDRSWRAAARALLSSWWASDAVPWLLNPPNHLTYRCLETPGVS